MALASSFSSSVRGGSVLLVLLRHDHVDLVLRSSRRELGLGLLQLLIDDGLELLERLRAREQDAVDEARGRSVDADLRGLGVVVLDLLLPGVSGDARLELGDVDADLLRPRLVVVGVEAALIVEGLVVPLPECLAALERHDAHRRFGGGLGVRVHGKRLVLPDDADLLRAVRLLDLLDRRIDLRAEGALEVREVNQRHRRGARAPHRVLARDGNGRVVVRPLGGARRGGVGTNLAAANALLVVAPHEHGAGQEAEDEADDGHTRVDPHRLGGDCGSLFLFSTLRFFGHENLREEGMGDPRRIIAVAKTELVWTRRRLSRRALDAVAVDTRGKRSPIGVRERIRGCRGKNRERSGEKSASSLPSGIRYCRAAAAVMASGVVRLRACAIVDLAHVNRGVRLLERRIRGEHGGAAGVAKRRVRACRPCHEPHQGGRKEGNDNPEPALHAV